MIRPGQLGHQTNDENAITLNIEQNRQNAGELFIKVTNNSKLKKLNNLSGNNKLNTIGKLRKYKLTRAVARLKV